MKHKRALGLFLLISPFTNYTFADERPNFVWMMSEDVSPHFLGLYNQGLGAETPNVERLAREGFIFNNAYSNAPVSSVARSTLITGCYAPRLGLSLHRKLEEVPLPEALNMFPAYLRKAGYHTSNAAKTDYNCFLDKTAWNVVKGKMGEWRNRKDKNQPFFFVRTNAASHESCLHFSTKNVSEKPTYHSVDKVKLLPFHPDTELFRYTYATFYDKVKKVDEELGRMIDMLQEDGVLDNTFIFYFGDNGGSLPGSKGYTGETGLKVPLVVYVPKKWRDKIPVPVNSRIDGFVSFMDFGPTLLHLAGVEVPKEMDGTPFLGKDITKKEMNDRQVVYGYGSRFDELYAFNRTVRKGNLKYSRNFLPYHPKSLYATYRYKQAAFREWKEMFEQGKLNPVQSAFFLPQGPEELYDLSIDPYETRNLASDPKYKNKLAEMRNLLKDNMLKKNDLGLVPECVWMKEAQKAPSDYGIKSHKRLARLMQTTDLQLQNNRNVERDIIKALNSSDPVERYWALTACIWHQTTSSDVVELINQIQKNDPAIYVRSRALVYQAHVHHKNPVAEAKSLLQQVKSKAEALQVLNDAAYLKETCKGCDWNLDKKAVPFTDMNIEWRLDYINP